MTAGFKTPLTVQDVDDKTWVLFEDLVWEGSKGDVFVVEAGEETDFATVPWWTQSVLPRTGTWTKASVLHDKMCREQARFYAECQAWKSTEGLPDCLRPPEPVPPVFDSNDTDAIFHKNALDGGTDIVRAELLWLGVRYGALANPARRHGWQKTIGRVAIDTIVLLVLLYFIFDIIAWVIPW